MNKSIKIGIENIYYCKIDSSLSYNLMSADMHISTRQINKTKQNKLMFHYLLCIAFQFVGRFDVCLMQSAQCVQWRKTEINQQNHRAVWWQTKNVNISLQAKETGVHASKKKLLDDRLTVTTSALRSQYTRAQCAVMRRTDIFGFAFLAAPPQVIFQFRILNDQIWNCGCDYRN